jgi:hypothetical protein
MNVEVFADDRVAITTNVFPTLTSSTCIGIAVPEGPTAGCVLTLDAYRLAPAPVTGTPP